MNKLKIKKRPDGRFERQITLHDAVTGRSYRRHVYAYSQAELAEKIAKIQADAAGLAKAAHTVEGFIAYFMEARREADPGTSTLDTYDILIRNYIAGTDFSRMALKSASVPACRQFLRQFRPLRGSGERTKQLLYVFLHMVFRQAVRERVIRDNPFDFIEKPRHTAAERLTLTPGQFDAILASLPTEQMRRLFRFARNTGMRRGEICGIRIMDVNLEAGFVCVRQAVKAHQHQWVQGAPKTATSIRNIAIPPSLAALIREQLDYVAARCARAAVPVDGYLPLFLGDNLAPLAPSTLSNAFLRARRKAGLPEGMSFHSLRATVATYLAEHDVSPKKIQAKLGHSTAAMTLNRYVKTTPVMQEGLTELLDAL